MIAILVEGVLVVVLAGLWVRGRWRLLVSFALYVATVLAGNVLVTWWPETFWVPGFWVAKETAYAVLILSMAVELAWATFRPFPGAETAFHRLLALALIVMGVLLVAAPDRDSSFLAVAGELLPRISTVTVWLLAGILALAHWYRIPWEPFHLRVAAALVAYAGIFGSLLRLEGIYGWSVQPYLNAIDPPAYLALTVWWAAVAWGRLPERSARQVLLERLQESR